MIVFHRTLFVMGLLAIPLMLSSPPVNAQQRKVRDVVDDIEKRLKSLSSSRSDEIKKLKALQQEQSRADNENTVSKRRLSKAKKDAEEEAESSPDLKAAREHADKVRGEITSLRKKIAETLKTHDDYRQADQDHQQAVAESKSLSGSDATESRRANVKKIAEAERRLRAIEDVAMNDNMDAKLLKAKLKAAESSVATEVKKTRETIEKNSELSAAKAEFQRTRDTLKSVRLKLTAVETRVMQIDTQMRGLANTGQSLQGDAQRELQRDSYNENYKRSGTSCGNCGFEGRNLAVNQRCPNCGVLFKGMQVKTR